MMDEEYQLDMAGNVYMRNIRTTADLDRFIETRPAAGRGRARQEKPLPNLKGGAEVKGGAETKGGAEKGKGPGDHTRSRTPGLGGKDRFRGKGPQGNIYHGSKHATHVHPDGPVSYEPELEVSLPIEANEEYLVSMFPTRNTGQRRRYPQYAYANHVPFHEQRKHGNPDQYKFVRCREETDPNFDYSTAELQQINKMLIELHSDEIKGRPDYTWTIYCPLFQKDWNTRQGQTEKTSLFTAPFLDALVRSQGRGLNLSPEEMEIEENKQVYDFYQIPLGPNARYQDIATKRPSMQLPQGGDQIRFGIRYNSAYRQEKVETSWMDYWGGSHEVSCTTFIKEKPDSPWILFAQNESPLYLHNISEMDETAGTAHLMIFFFHPSLRNIKVSDPTVATTLNGHGKRVGNLLREHYEAQKFDQERFGLPRMPVDHRGISDAAADQFVMQHMAGIGVEPKKMNRFTGPRAPVPKPPAPPVATIPPAASEIASPAAAPTTVPMEVSALPKQPPAPAPARDPVQPSPANSAEELPSFSAEAEELERERQAQAEADRILARNTPDEAMPQAAEEIPSETGTPMNVDSLATSGASEEISYQQAYQTTRWHDEIHTNTAFTVWRHVFQLTFT